MTACQPYREKLDDVRAIASVSCEAGGFQATYTAFQNAGDMRLYFDASESSLPNGSCAEAWKREGVWEDPDGAIRGRMKCYDSDGAPTIEWMDSDKYIHGTMFGEPGQRDALLEAWGYATP